MKYDLPDAVRVETDGPIRTVVLNRPEYLNAANPELHAGVANVWGQIAADPEARAVVLTGAGRAFCAGGDMSWFERIQVDFDERRRSMAQAKVIAREMLAFPLPVIAAVNGPAVGLGCSLAISSDIVLISDRAFLADPHVAMGLVAGDGGAVLWPMVMSFLQAKEYLFTGERISAQRAVELGLANRMVPDDDLMGEARSLAVRLAGLPARALQDTKRAVNMQIELMASSVLEYALAAESECFLTEDHQSRVRAFKERS